MVVHQVAIADVHHLIALHREAMAQVEVLGPVVFVLVIQVKPETGNISSGSPSTSVNEASNEQSIVAVGVGVGAIEQLINPAGCGKPPTTFQVA
jgi:hypothetical protein